MVRVNNEEICKVRVRKSNLTHKNNTNKNPQKLKLYDYLHVPLLFIYNSPSMVIGSAIYLDTNKVAFRGRF